MNDSLRQVSAIILAAGKGTRMQSDLPKVLHTIADKPIVWHTLQTLSHLHLGKILLVVGHKQNEVKKALGASYSYILQKKQLGTGHAVLQALPFIPKETTIIMVLNGDDSAFYKPETLANLVQQHQQSKAKMTILTTVRKNVAISGRVIRDNEGKIIGIKANAAMTEEELKNNNELVCGIYLFDRVWLETHLPKVEISSKREYNITGLIDTAIQQSSLQARTLKGYTEWQSINTQEELEKARELWEQLYR